MGDHWRVSALVTKLKDPEENLFKNLLETWKPKKNKIPKIDPKKLKSLNPVLSPVPII